MNLRDENKKKAIIAGGLLILLVIVVFFSFLDGTLNDYIVVFAILGVGGLIFFMLYVWAWLFASDSLIRRLEAEVEREQAQTVQPSGRRQILSELIAVRQGIRALEIGDVDSFFVSGKIFSRGQLDELRRLERELLHKLNT